MLNSVDLSKKLDRSTYKKKLIDHQLRLRELAHELYVQNGHWWWSSKDGMPPAKAAPFVG